MIAKYLILHTHPDLLILLQKKERWHRGKGNRCHKTEIDMPSVIGKYNKCMGGIDKMDSMIGMFPCKLKVKRWPMNIFWHMIDLTIGNAWLLYQIEYKRKNRNDKYFAQFDFKRHVAECWMAQNACPTNHRLLNRLGRAGRASVPHSIRYDTKDHLPDATCGATERKQCAVCKSCTNV